MQVMNFGWVLDDELAGSQGPASLDDLSFLYSQGVRAIVRMEERTIAANNGNQFDLVDLFVPVPDFTPPDPDQILRMIEFIDRETAAKRPVVVSCYAGIGRTGTVLACYLIHRGQDPVDAINRIRELRPGSIQTPEQEEAVYGYAEWVADEPGEN
ncbi:MAG: protein tyrosine phosphatase [SAR202 cluster bacterium]|nr:protein tyrosine phosphatase [SAR202 cluster bacterium]|tara:strand:+ start:3027 stop:3491 length:465 start_codon:yes stop_codon:yes gene_type:complete